MKENVVEYVEFLTYEQTNLDLDPIIILPCRHFYTRSYLDRALEMDKVYVMDENNEFVESIPNASMTSQRANCQACRSPVSQVQRYNRVIKRAILDTILRNSISRAHSQYLELVDLFDTFKADLEVDRDGLLERLRPIRNAMNKRPLTAKNGAIIVNRLNIFEPMKNRIRQYLREVDESRQPHMKVYRMSIAARSRAKTDIEGTPGVYWPSDIPSPDIKHRVLGNILDYRLEVSRNAEMLQFGNRVSSLTGCNEDSTALHEKVIKQCTNLRSKSSEHKAECDGRQYYSHGVELILIQIDLLALEIRASVVVQGSNVQNLREIGMKLLEDCEGYFRRYPSTRNFQSAAERAGKTLRVLGPFYEAVSQEERSAIYQAMRGEFGSSIRWYYCLNGHPVCLQTRPLANSSSLWANVAGRWKRPDALNAVNLLVEEIILQPRVSGKLRIFISYGNLFFL